MHRTRRAALAAVVGLGAGLAGCSGGDGTRTPTADGGTSTARGDLTSLTGPPEAFAYTHLQPTGNRWVADASTDLREVSRTDVPIDGEPAWVVARPAGDATAEWLVVTTDGSVTGVRVGEGTERFEPPRAGLAGGAPPCLRRGGPADLLAPPGEAEAPTHPFPVADGVALTVDDGAVVRHTADGSDRVEVGALPDARFASVDDARVAVLGGATDRYGHGALGDDTEAGTVVLLNVDGGLAVERETPVPGGRVVEGIQPIVAPFAGLDPAIVVTESGPERGAALVAYGTGGERMAGPAIGSGFRWRHQLCVAPFAPDGTPELAVVRTPHIGGTVEFYRREGDELAIAARRDGHSSHALGSRNLDGAIAADVDGDGRPELVVPDDPRASLRVLRRTDAGVEEVDSLDAGGRITSNVHAVETGPGLQLGVARRVGLRVWR